MQLTLCRQDGSVRRDTDMDEIVAIAKTKAARRVPCPQNPTPQQAAVYEQLVDDATKDTVKAIRAELAEKGEVAISPYTTLQKTS